MHDPHLTTSVLDTLRHACCVSLGETKILDLAAGTEQWIAKGEDYYETACALAELVGLELEDG